VSGPKGYSPPVYMTKGELEASLRGVFALQALIKRLSIELVNLSVNDLERNIHFSCDPCENECITALSPFQPYGSGPIQLSTFNRIQPEINAKISQLKALEAKLKSTKNDFLRKQNDYNSYLELETFHIHAQSIARTLKQDSKTYIKKYHDEGIDIDSLLNKIYDLPSLDTVPNFHFGFLQKINGYKNEINQQISEIQDQLKSIRFSCGGDEIPEEDRLLSDVAKKFVGKIRKNLPGIANAEERAQFVNRLKILLASQVSVDDYFSEELSEDISKSITTQIRRQTINELLQQINNIPQHSSTENMRTALSEKISSLLSGSSIKEREVVSMESSLALYLQETTTIIETEDATAREKQYIRSQIIQGLNGLGFEVADEEPELVDFSKGGEYIMRIPDQDNFIRIGFNEDGSFIYNFMIPEDKSNLSIESTQHKLSEMDSSCQLFKQVIVNLTAQGIDLNLSREQPIDQRFLIQAPGRYRKTPTKTTKRKISTEQLHNKQLGAE